MTNPEGTPLGGMPVAVDVAGIEKELASLWRTQSKEKAQALTRACSWNLIIHCADDAAVADAKRTADALVRSVPTRTIIVKNQPYATGKEIEAWVSANCHVGAGGGKLLCTEEIHIESRGKGGEHVPSLLRALLVPDVPTALWWHGEPPDNAAAIRMLLSGVDRLIVDTAGSGGALSKLAHVGGLLDGLVLADLNWLRTATLRSVLASLFDAPTGHLPLFHLRRVHLQADERGRAAARLMVAWLTSRLKWTVQERIPRASGASWRVLSRDESPIAVDVEQVPACARASGLHSLVLEAQDGVRYGFVAAADGIVTTLGPAPLAREVGAIEPPLEQLLVAALGARGRDRLYGVALHRAIELDK
jgi:glucose-6-phosphate dehydrogenase assembly protein OpcA